MPRDPRFLYQSVLTFLALLCFFWLMIGSARSEPFKTGNSVPAEIVCFSSAPLMKTLELAIQNDKDHDFLMHLLSGECVVLFGHDVTLTLKQVLMTYRNDSHYVEVWEAELSGQTVYASISDVLLP